MTVSRPSLTLLLLTGLLSACASGLHLPTPTDSAMAATQATAAPADEATAPHGAAQPGDAAAAANVLPSRPPGPPGSSGQPGPSATTTEALLEDSLRPGVKVDLNEAQTQLDLWERLRAGFAMPELSNEGVRRAEAWYAARPDYVQRMTERGSRYLFHIIEEVEKRGMPSELALLPFVESAFVTHATSRAKASGMWQFMPATGRDFDLKQNIFRDDRRSVLASTRAALDYLGRLHKQFGDWHLALAAYNWGQGNVGKAIARNQKAGLPTDYESLRMPNETRYYIPKLQAVKNLVLAPGMFGLSLPPIANHPYFLSVNIDRDMDVELAARLAGISLDEFKLFNPQMNKPVILAASTEQILLPYENASAFVTNLAAHRGPLASWTAWVVPRTMKPQDAAKHVGMQEPLLREINKIPPKMLVKKGSTLLVARAAHRQEDVSEQLADNASISLAPDAPASRLKPIRHKAGKGDTVASVAERYRVGVAQLASWNKTSAKAAFKPGQWVLVYQAQDTGRRVASKPVKKGKSVSAGRAGGAPTVGAKVGTMTRR